MGVHDWFDWSNAGVGVVGLAFTLWAVAQATGAKKAAENAGNSVKRHNAEVDFGALARMAKELHGYVEAGMTPEAKLRTTDLRSEFAVAMRLHKAFLKTQLSRLQEKQIDLKLVADGLNQGLESLSSSEKIRLLEKTGAILDVLAGQCGELRSTVENGVSNG
jgi:hypothetical protein